ncbi:MAG: YiiG family protein [Deltaproteobacteria bacterium]|nr:YiiG family protein [Deltaproteobacteria bacterium]
MKKVLPIFLSLCFLFLAACHGDNPLSSSPSSSSNQSVNSKLDSPQFTRKYNQYISFINHTHSSVYRSYENYFRWADRDKGPQADQRIGNVSPFSWQPKSFEDYLNQEPSFGLLDEKAKILSEKTTKAHELLKEADNYYSRQDYKDDNLAKGKQLHTQLVQSLEEYETAYTAMRNEFDKLEAEVLAKQYADFQEQGYHIRYNMMKNLDAAESLSHVVGELDGEDLKKIDLSAYDQAFQAFRESLEAIEKYAKDDAQIKKEFSSPVAKSMLDSYSNYASNFIKNARRLKERIEKNDFNYGPAHPTIAAGGSPKALENSYRELVKYNNRMN